MNAIRKLREELNFTQDKFAKMINRSKSMVIKMEAGDRIKNKRFPSTVTIKVIKKIALKHNIPFDTNELIK